MLVCSQFSSKQFSLVLKNKQASEGGEKLLLEHFIEHTPRALLSSEPGTAAATETRICTH